MLLCPTLWLTLDPGAGEGGMVWSFCFGINEVVVMVKRTIWVGWLYPLTIAFGQALSIPIRNFSTIL